MLVEQSKCPHRRVVREENDEGYENWPKVWKCLGCDLRFVPEPLVGQIEAQSDALIDMATGMFSAVLWDLHERAREAGQISPDDPTPDERTEEVCAELPGGHDRGEDGVCKRCGNSPFLGT